ncbi:hypothetical protein CEE69_26680 [Rhodopirellula bahusiensis]|uniref:Uncharacterized protein n=1 Tax=Rhodopirellula bahusiensis TaxID=2014065 RepID=A0A2G1VZJ3_9BACT|nr:hypothetical protein CEE69_26680 [Rhodopirellula bahusiensis]
MFVVVFYAAVLSYARASDQFTKTRYRAVPAGEHVLDRCFQICASGLLEFDGSRHGRLSAGA